MTDMAAWLASLPKTGRYKGTLYPCHGTHQRTGRTVGSRHRWLDGWGVGRCQWCHQTLEQLVRPPQPEDPK